MAKSYVRNCHLEPRRSGEILFSSVDGAMHASLNRYAVIPIERYKALVKQAAAKASRK